MWILYLIVQSVTMHYFGCRYEENSASHTYEVEEGKGLLIAFSDNHGLLSLTLYLNSRSSVFSSSLTAMWNLKPCQSMYFTLSPTCSLNGFLQFKYLWHHALVIWKILTSPVIQVINVENPHYFQYHYCFHYESLNIEKQSNLVVETTQTWILSLATNAVHF